MYDCVAKRFLARGAVGRATVTVPADSAVVLVLAPAGGKVTRTASKLLIDDVVVDYRAGARSP